VGYVKKGDRLVGQLGRTGWTWYNYASIGVDSIVFNVVFGKRGMLGVLKM
jgi:hypothetical protein